MGVGVGSSNMIFTYDFHIFSDSGGLQELMKGEMCVCVLCLFWEDSTVTGSCCWGLCVDNIMSSHFHG